MLYILNICNEACQLFLNEKEKNEKNQLNAITTCTCNSLPTAVFLEEDISFSDVGLSSAKPR